MSETRGLSILGYNRECDRLEAEIKRLEAVLRRLASPEAFYMSRATNEEDRARMRFAEEALETDDG